MREFYMLESDKAAKRLKDLLNEEKETMGHIYSYMLARSTDTQEVKEFRELCAWMINKDLCDDPVLGNPLNSIHNVFAACSIIHHAIVDDGDFCMMWYPVREDPFFQDDPEEEIYEMFPKIILGQHKMDLIHGESLFVNGKETFKGRKWEEKDFINGCKNFMNVYDEFYRKKEEESIQLDKDMAEMFKELDMELEE